MASKLLSRYLLSIIHSFIMMLYLFVIVLNMDLLSIFDCRISNESEHGYIVNHQSLSASPFTYYLSIFSMFYFAMDSLIEYFCIATKQQNILNCHRLQLLSLYRWIIILNEFIIYNRSKYLQLLLILIGLSESSTFILCSAHLTTEYLQNTKYLRTACFLTVLLSITTRIILSALLVIGCIYYRCIYWQQLRAIEFGPDLIFDSIHILSFVNIFSANIWWTYSLHCASKKIPITYHEAKPSKKDD